MKRILMILSVAALAVAMLIATAMPALAAGQGEIRIEDNACFKGQTQKSPKISVDQRASTGFVCVVNSGR